MTSIRRIAGSAALLASLALPVSAAEEPVSQMTLGATGQASAAPDQAIVRFGVETVDAEAAEAMDRNGVAMQRAFEALAAAGLVSEDIETSGLSLSPRMSRPGSLREEGAPRIEGYQARNSVAATVRDVDAVGDVIDSLLAGGVNAIDGIEFGVSDAADLEALARARAAAAVQEKAAQYAEAFGLPIEGVISISEGSGSHGPQPMMMMAASRSGGTPVAAGDYEVTVTVSATFRLGAP